MLHGCGWTVTAGPRTSTVSTASASWMASWTIWRMRFDRGGARLTFGLYSGLLQRGPQHMSRILMAAENRDTAKLSDERKKALNLAITQIEKTCGKGAIMRMGADSPRVRVDAIPTGAINLDAAIGDRKSTRLNSSHRTISYAVFCLKKKKIKKK